MAYKIKTLNKISPIGLKQFGAGFEVSDAFEAPDAIIVRSATVDTDAYSGVLAVARAGAGFNNISVDKATEKGVCVFNTPGANANAVAELVFIMLGMAARNIHTSLDFIRSLNAEADDKLINEKVEQGKSRYTGFELAGKRLGVFGLGKIGVLVANAGVDHGMNVTAYDPFPTVGNVHLLNPRVEIARSADELIGQSDVISVHVPLSEKTRNLIGTKALSKVKDGVVLMNYARKGIYDDSAVLRAIGAGKVRTYITDFPSRELLGNPDVICTPHLGASTAESEENCAVMAARELKDYLQYGVVTHSVNFPVIDAIPTQDTITRLVVINRDIPHMIANITQVLGNHGLNIQALTNESNGKVGYNLIDLESKVSEEVVRQIEGLPNVIRVRCLEFANG